MAKSILYQLKQYQPEKPQLVIQVEDTSPPGLDPEELDRLTDQIVATSRVPSYQCNEYWKVVREQLSGFSKHENAGVVYPLIVAARYYLFYAYQHRVGEVAADRELKVFLEAIPREEYMRRFLAAFNATAKRLTLYRALVATFPDFKKKSDKLPRYWRDDILGELGIECGRVGLAQDILEQFQKSVGVNEIILGRLGYMILHGSQAGREVLPKLLAHKPQK